MQLADESAKLRGVFLELRAAFSLFQTDDDGDARVEDIATFLKQTFPDIRSNEISDMTYILDPTGNLVIHLQRKQYAIIQQS